MPTEQMKRAASAPWCGLALKSPTIATVRICSEYCHSKQQHKKLASTCDVKPTPSAHEWQQCLPGYHSIHPR